MDPVQEANGSASDGAFAKWPLLCLFVGWGVGAAGFAVAVHSGLLPTAPEVGVTELTAGAILYGLFLGLTAAQVAQSAVRERSVPWLVLAGMVLGMAAGAALGYAIVREFFGAVWTGFGGILAGGFVGTTISRGRTNRCT